MESNALSSIVSRIPIFQGFSSEQVERTLEVCEKRSLQSGEHLFKEGDPSTEMLILLSGHLSVRTSIGPEIAVIGEMGLVGEMGVLTDQPRSASVVTTQPSEVLTIGRDDLFRLMDSDKSMGFKIYQNVTQILCERLRDNNILLEQQYLILEDLAGEA